MFSCEILDVTQPAPDVWMPWDSCTFEVEMLLEEESVSLAAYMHDGVLAVQGPYGGAGTLTGVVNLWDWSHSFTRCNENNIYTGLVYG